MLDTYGSPPFTRRQCVAARDQAPREGDLRRLRGVSRGLFGTASRSSPIPRGFLDGRLTFTPVETWKGRGYHIEGRARISVRWSAYCKTLIVASPEGVEPSLAT